MKRKNRIGGVILAGGKARRMEDHAKGDKALVSLAGQPLIQRVGDKAKSQVDDLIINAHGDEGRFQFLPYRIIPDAMTGFLGPLAGLHSGMKYFSPRQKWMASFAVDTPFFPDDFVTKAHDLMEQSRSDIVLARSDGRIHPVFGLWNVSLCDSLEQAIMEGIRKIDRWTALHKVAFLDYDTYPIDPFFNINNKEDLKRAELYIKEREKK